MYFPSVTHSSYLMQGSYIAANDASYCLANLLTNMKHILLDFGCSSANACIGIIQGHPSQAEFFLVLSKGVSLCGFTY